MLPTTVEAFAPAKVNLSLHVVGQRPDGYHLIDSLVAFGVAADRLILTPSDKSELSITGPESAGLPSGAGNLAFQAARLVGTPISITLEKYLPVAAGLGGGSSDAAAVLRGIQVLAGGAREYATEQLVSLGADLPVCFGAQSARIRGIGECVEPVDLPDLPVVLANPRCGLSTSSVFSQLQSKANAPMPDELPNFRDSGYLIEWLLRQRNDLDAPAQQISSSVAIALRALEQSHALLVRMSGSGATCFGIFETEEAATSAAEMVRDIHPDWWIKDGILGGRSNWLSRIC